MFLEREVKAYIVWQCRKSVPQKSFYFHFAWSGWSVSINGGRKEDIRKRVVPESLFASSVRFAVVRVRGLPCDVERLPLVELLVLPVSDVWCFAEFHVTFKHCTSGSSAFSKVVLKTSDGCSSTCSGVGQNPQHSPVSFMTAKLAWRNSCMDFKGGNWTEVLKCFFCLCFFSSNKLFFLMDIVE